MDRNTLTGLLLIGAIIIGFSILNRPSEEEVEAAKRRQDSLEQVKSQNEAQIERELEAVPYAETPSEMMEDSTSSNDSILDAERLRIYGAFANASVGEGQMIKVENELMTLYFNTKGGKLEKATLKQYDTYEGQDLVLHGESR